jgi:hypothetical protein
MSCTCSSGNLEICMFHAIQNPASSNAKDETDKLFSATQALLGSRSDNLLVEWRIADLDLATMLNRLILHGDPVVSPLVAYASRQWQRLAGQLPVTRPRRRNQRLRELISPRRCRRRLLAAGSDVCAVSMFVCVSHLRHRSGESLLC